MPRAPVAVTVLTGFLGAGKTTLLNRLLGDPALARTAVIVNEFGEIAIDHLLVEQANDGLIELSGGCLCCTVRGDLVDTLTDLAGRVEAGRIEPIERVVIETTGLADPAPVLKAIMAHPELVRDFRLDGVVTVVDAVNGGAAIDAHEEAMRQVAMADRLVVSKRDLASDDEWRALAARLTALNPRARQLSAPDVQPGEMLDCGLYDPASKTADVERWLGEPDHGHDLHGHAHDHHEGARHHGRIRSFTLSLDRAVPLAAVEGFLDLLRATSGENVLRMKGIVELAEDPGSPLVIHAVQKVLHPPARLPGWPPGPRGTRLVLITTGLDENYVRRLFSAFTGQAAIDTPDRAAIESNPLAIPGTGGA